MDVLDEIGKYYGYPACCINGFGVIIANGGAKTYEQQHNSVHKFTGFIPCPTHAKQVFSGDITLESLINNRICPHEFPQGGSMEELDEHLLSVKQSEVSYVS